MEMYVVSLDINLLRVFVAIAEEASFTGAGRRLYRTQSTVSLQLKRLEGQLGKTLVKRMQGRVIGLTDAGEILLDHARGIIHANDEATAALGKPALSGTVRLGLPDETAHSAVSRALSAFRSRYPQVRLEVICRLSQELEALVGRGQLDLALVNRCDPGATLLPEHLYTETLGWVAHKTLSWQPNQPIPLASFPPGCCYRIRALAALEAAGIEWVEVYTSSSYYGVKEAAAAGLGLAALPISGPPHPGSSGRFSADLPALEDVEVILLCTPARKTEAVSCLSSHIRMQVSRQGDTSVVVDA